MLRTWPGEVRGHRVHRVGEILPRAGHARHLCLAAELAFGADLARHARHFGGEAVELIDHRVDGFLQLQNLALHIDGDLSRKIAARHGRGHRRDVADLRREVGRHRVHGVGQVLPGAGHARHHRLAAEAPVGADFARHARHFRGERTELIHHRVDGFLELQNLAAHIDGDLLGQVAVRHRDGHVGDVADLRRQVAGHLVDGLGEVLPHARDALHLRLAAELALGADLARHARHFRSEDRKLLDHRIDQLRRAQELALELAAVHLQLHGLPEIALGDRADGARHFRRRPHQIVEQRIQGIDIRRPPADRSRHRHALLEPAFLADRHAQPRDLPRDAILMREGLVESLRNPPIRPRPAHRQPHREIAIAKRPHRLKKLQRARLRGVLKRTRFQPADLPLLNVADGDFLRERVIVVSVMVHRELETGTRTIESGLALARDRA